MKYCPQCMKPLLNGQCPDGCPPLAEDPLPHILPPGTLLNNRYLVGRTLGQGGFGITYIGRDQVLDIRVAIKEYYPSGFVTRNVTASQAVIATGQDKRDLLSQESEKFLEEARILAKFIGEPGIVDVRDYFRANNTAYIVMEYLDGENLRDCVLRQGRLTPEKTFALLEPVMRSLDKVHQAGLIHRDVSPDNVMLLSGGNVKLLDFGTARSASPYGEQSLSVMLKPGYAPEEQYRSKGSQGPWTDIYGLCATMYKCITGITPEDSLQRLYEDTVQPPSKLGIPIPPAQEAALMMGMACRMKDRFQSIGALAAALGISGFALPPEQAEMPSTVLVTEEPPGELTRHIFQERAQEPSTRPLFREQREEEQPPPQTPPAPPKMPPAPPKKPPAQQKKTSKSTETRGALIVAGVFLLVIAAVVLTTFQVLRVIGIMPNRSTGDRFKEDHSNASVSDSGSAGDAVTLYDEESALIQLMPPQFEAYTSYSYAESLKIAQEANLQLSWLDVNDTVYECHPEDYYESGEILGYCVKMEVLGFNVNEAITLMVGIDSNNTVTGVVILEHHETVGTGTRAMTDSILEQYKGYSDPDSVLEEIDTVSGATNTSNAIKFSVYRAMEIVKIFKQSPAFHNVPTQGGSSSGSSSADDPTEAAKARITQYATVESFDPLTRLGAAELAAGHLNLILSDDPGLPFEDCRGCDRQERAVIKAVTDNGLMSGLSDETFQPDSTMSVAEMVYLMWTISGCPEPDPTRIAFTAVSSDHWAYSAFVWLANTGAIPNDFSEDPNNTANGKFMLNTLVTLSTQ